jgi:hypothetical protein
MWLGALLLFGACSSSAAAATTAGPSSQFGGWLFIDHDGGGGGSPPAFLSTATDLLFFSFIDPSTMTVPGSFATALPQLATNKTIMFTIGGEDWGNKWNWTSSIDDAVAKAHEVAKWRKLYPGLDGIDIDAENQVEQSKPEVMAAFVRALKDADPGILISLCVYGNPEGRALHNYLINNLLANTSFPQGIDWINIMGYGGLQSNIRFAEEYTHAPHSKWDHPINAAVPANQVVMGIKAAGAFSSCAPSDYTGTAEYVLANGLRGASVWTFVYDNSTLTSSWYKPNCVTGCASEHPTVLQPHTS